METTKSGFLFSEVDQKLSAQIGWINSKYVQLVYFHISWQFFSPLSVDNVPMADLEIKTIVNNENPTRQQPCIFCRILCNELEREKCFSRTSSKFKYHRPKSYVCECTNSKNIILKVYSLILATSFYVIIK